MYEIFHEVRDFDLTKYNLDDILQILRNNKNINTIFDILEFRYTFNDLKFARNNNIYQKIKEYMSEEYIYKFGPNNMAGYYLIKLFFVISIKCF